MFGGEQIDPHGAQQSVYNIAEVLCRVVVWFLNFVLKRGIINNLVGLSIPIVIAKSS